MSHIDPTTVAYNISDKAGFADVYCVPCASVAASLPEVIVTPMRRVDMPDDYDGWNICGNCGRDVFQVGLRRKED